MKDNERTVDGGGAGAAVREGKAGEFFHQGNFPNVLALGCDGDTATVGHLEVNVTGFGIDDW